MPSRQRFSKKTASSEASQACAKRKLERQATAEAERATNGQPSIQTIHTYPVFKGIRCRGSLRGAGAVREGPVAQLGERLVCIQEVVGSNPVGSTPAS